jgi:hypothetical protein
VNKRQRKKRLKKITNYMSGFLRDALKHKIGEQLNAARMLEVQTIIGDTIKAKLAQPSFVHQILEPMPTYTAPFRMWRELGAGQLTHHVGVYPYIRGDGSTIWKRLCDDATVDETFILSNDEAVNCFGCLAKEDIIYASKTDL